MSNKVLFRIQILILKMMTKVAKFTLCATILSLSYEIKCDVSSPLNGFQHLLCDKCNNTFDSTSQVVYISHLGVVQNVLTNPEKKKSREKRSDDIAGQGFWPSFSNLSVLAYFCIFYQYKMTSGQT